MTVAAAPRPTNRYLDRPAPSSLADVINTILDKGIVIDIYIRVSLVGIELLTIDARIVIASVDTYLRFAEAVNRLDLTETQTSGIPELMEDINKSGSRGRTGGAIEGAKEKLSEMFTSGDNDEEDQADRPRSQSRQPAESSRPRQTGERRKSSEEG